MLLILKKLRKNLGIFFSLIFILFCLIISVFAYFIIPDDSQYSNQMHLEINSMPPGFKTFIIEIPNNQKKSNNHLSEKFLGNKFPNKEIVAKKYNLSKNGIEILNYNNEKQLISYNLFPKTFNLLEIEKEYVSQRKYIFGTDRFGRDYFGRIILGTRASLSIGFLAVFISLIIGLFIGMIGGYFGGIIDKLMVTLINIFWSIPTLLLVIAISVALGKGFWQVYIAVGLTMWVEVARIVRGQVISEKNKDYILATKVLGYSTLRIFYYHLLPNIIGPILIICAANFASAILIESGLSFLGIGTQPPVPSWGSMIKDNFQFIMLGKSYLALIPGFSIMLLVTCFMFLGNNLQDFYKESN